MRDGIVLAALTVAIVIGVAGYYAYKYTTETPKGAVQYDTETAQVTQSADVAEFQRDSSDAINNV